MGAASLHHLGGGLHPINDVGHAVQPSDDGVIGDLELQTALIVIDHDLLHWPAQRIAAWTNDSSQQQLIEHEFVHVIHLISKRGDIP